MTDTFEMTLILFCLMIQRSMVNFLFKESLRLIIICCIDFTTE